MKTTTNSPQETRDLAAKIAADLVVGDILVLEGDLGAGKTEFVRGLAEALDAKDGVRSPSFTLLNSYRTENPIFKEIIHVDLYRLLETDAKTNLTEDIGLDEYIDREDVLIVIEWPAEEVLKLLPNAKQIRFHFGESENERIIHT